MAYETEPKADPEMRYVGFHPELIFVTSIHGLEKGVAAPLDAHLSEAALPYAVHIPEGNPDAVRTNTRGTILSEEEARKNTHGVTYVYVREGEGQVSVSARKPLFDGSGWTRRPMLDLNRMSREHAKEASLLEHIERLFYENPRDQRVGILSKFVTHPIGLVVSIHEDLEHHAHRPKWSPFWDGIYLYATGTRRRISAIRPVLQRGLARMKEDGYAVYTGIDDPFDTSLRRVVRGGIIEDVIGEESDLDGTLEMWLASQSLRGMTADGRTPLHYPVVLTVEVPGKATPDQKRGIVDGLMEHVINPAWNTMFSGAGRIQ